MKCIGRCPREWLSDIIVESKMRPSQLTIRGVSADICRTCGEVVYGSRKIERRMLETRRIRLARRAAKVDIRRVRGSEQEHEADWDY